MKDIFLPYCKLKENKSAQAPYQLIFQINDTSRAFASIEDVTSFLISRVEDFLRIVVDLDTIKNNSKTWENVFNKDLVNRPFLRSSSYAAKNETIGRNLGFNVHTPRKTPPVVTDTPPPYYLGI